MTLADRLVNELMLVSVLVAGEGAAALAASLAVSGAAAEALQAGQAAEGFDLAILLTDPEAAGHAATRVLVETLSRASDRVLLAPLPLGQGASGSPGLPQLPAWFELFAELGYQPVVEFDASFVSAGAFLVDRAATADEGDLAAFTDRLQLGNDAARVQREAVQEAERNVRSELLAARDALDARNTDLADAQAALQAAKAGLAEMTSRAAQMAEAIQAAETRLQDTEQRNAGWDGLRTWVRLEASHASRNTLAALMRDLPRLNALRLPDLPPVTLPALKRRFWFARSTVQQHPVLEQAALVRGCPLFDAAWYVAANPDISEGQAVDPAFHYVLVGGPRGADPGPWFDTAAYVGAHPEAAGGPLLHAIKTGAVEKGAVVEG